MSGHSHTATGAEKNISVVNKMGFCAAMTGIQETDEKKGRQVKYFFNNIETSRSIMGLMVDLTNVGDMFNLRVVVTSAASDEANRQEAEKVVEKLSKYFA